MGRKYFKNGFTLLELLIVISIIAILAVIIVLILNPAETLRKARDAQRLSDLSTIKTALAIFLNSTNTPYLAGDDNLECKSGTGAGTYSGADKIYYSLPTEAGSIIDTTLDGDTNVRSAQVDLANLGATDGTGWIPVDLESLTAGSPISNFPVDPVNTVISLGVLASTDLVYRYVCNASSTSFEIDAQLESNSYTIEDDKRKKDGGNNANYYEVGTNLKLLGTGTDF